MTTGVENLPHCSAALAERWRASFTRVAAPTSSGPYSRRKMLLPAGTISASAASSRLACAQPRATVISTPRKATLTLARFPEGHRRLGAGLPGREPGKPLLHHAGVGPRPRGIAVASARPGHQRLRHVGSPVEHAGS